MSHIPEHPDSAPPSEHERLLQRAGEALRRGEFDLADKLLAREDVEMAALIENLRIYQTELTIQNEELRAAQIDSQHALERFSGLFAHLPLAELVVDRSGLIHAANDAAARLFALDNNHLRQHYLRRLIDPAHAGDLSRAIVVANEAGASQIGPVGFITAQATSFIGELHVARLPAREGESAQFVCAVVDLSERLRHEAERDSAYARLGESELRYRILAERSPDWEYWVRPDGRFEYVSPACEAICGHPPQAFLDNPELFSHLLHPEDRAAWHAHQTEHDAMGAGMHETLLLRLHDPDGNTRWLEHQCGSVHEGSTYLGRRGVNRDVTRRIQAEAEARHVGRLLHTLSEVNQFITRARDESRLIEEVCRVAVETGGLRASLAAMRDEVTEDFWLHAGKGFNGDMPDDWLPHLVADHVILPGGGAYPLRQPLSAPSAANPADAAWWQWLRGNAIGAVIHFPLEMDGRVIGLLSFFADTLEFLRADVCALLEELAGDLSYALESFNHRRQEFESRYRLAERDAYLDTMLQTVPMGIGVVSGRVFTEFNACVCDMLGYAREELLGHSVRMIYADDAEYERVGREKYADIARTGRGSLDTRWQRKDGRIIDVRVISTAFDRHDLGKGVVFTAEDISERKRADQALDRTRLQLEMAIEAADLGIYDFDLRAGTVDLNERYLHMLGYAPGELELTQPLWLSMIHPDDLPAVSAALLENPQRVLAGAEVEYRMRHKSGAWVWLLDRAKAYLDAESGEVIRAVGAHINLTSRKQTEARIDFLAHFDALTHLPNRELLRDRIEHALHRVAREGRQLAVLMIDLDRFKSVNESLGHTLGDALLQAAAVRMQGQLQGGDTLARVGGDEFILLLENDVSAHSASQVARHWLELFNPPIRVADKELSISVSIGLSLYPVDGDNVEDLLRHAEAALYNAKSQGRNNFQFYEPEMTAGAFEHLLLENALRGAVKRHELRLYYQPQVDLVSGALRGVEALVRWQHPDLGMIMPGRFIPLAEDAGIIGAIGEWVLREACRQMVDWEAAGLHVPCVAVNLSVQQIEPAKLAPMVAGLLAGLGLAGERLELEVTESLLMRDAEVALAVLLDLRKRGVRLAIDEFGTGYSSFSYLRRLPVHRLKIDQSFVRDIGQQGSQHGVHVSTGEAIVRAIIALGHSLGMETVAEGVETQQQADFLRGEACDIAQGYLYNRPVEAAFILQQWGPAGSPDEHGSGP